MTQNFNDCFTTWLQGVLNTVAPYLQDFLTTVPNEARYGKSIAGYFVKHRFVKRTIGVLLLTYWRAWEHNTWYATTDGQGCKQVLPLGSFITDRTIACWLREAECQGVDIRPLLKAAGVRPLPDGISVMQINGTEDCDGIIFQVGRQQRTDVSPEAPFLS